MKMEGCTNTDGLSLGDNKGASDTDGQMERATVLSRCSGPQMACSRARPRSKVTSAAKKKGFGSRLETYYWRLGWPRCWAACARRAPAWMAGRHSTDAWALGWYRCRVASACGAHTWLRAELGDVETLGLAEWTDQDGGHGTPG